MKTFFLKTIRFDKMVLTLNPTTWPNQTQFLGLQNLRTNLCTLLPLNKDTFSQKVPNIACNFFFLKKKKSKYQITSLNLQFCMAIKWCKTCQRPLRLLIARWLCNLLNRSSIPHNYPIKNEVNKYLVLNFGNKHEELILISF